MIRKSNNMLKRKKINSESKRKGKNITQKKVKRKELSFKKATIKKKKRIKSANWTLLV